MLFLLIRLVCVCKLVLFVCYWFGFAVWGLFGYFVGDVCDGGVLCVWAALVCCLRCGCSLLLVRPDFALGLLDHLCDLR